MLEANQDVTTGGKNSIFRIPWVSRAADFSAANLTVHLFFSGLNDRISSPSFECFRGEGKPFNELKVMENLSSNELKAMENLLGEDPK